MPDQPPHLPERDPKRAQQLFERAMELPVDERPSFIVDAVGDDDALGDAVAALVEAAEAADHDGLLQVPTDQLLAKPPTEFDGFGKTEKKGQMIGRYKLLQRLGEGGMGSVWMAEQTSPVFRRVALKVIKLGMDTKAVVARFEAERQALALMDHPHIARVLDAGVTDNGRPYFVMDLVRGDPITKYADKHNLDIPARLDLFRQVCSAVQHAHQKGVIHRDLKPANVLVATEDGRPFAKVIDFGIAKAISQRLTEKTLFTAHGGMIGTLEYMSPEQADGSLDVDTRSDVYSLGVILYELLTGTTPLDRTRFVRGAMAEWQRIIREEEPPKPSTRVSTASGTSPDVAKHRKSEPKRLGLLMRGELDWIVMKSLEKERARRYESPGAFADDVRRHAGGEPVEAAPPSTLYRAKKFAGKHRGPLAATAVIAVLLVAGISGTTTQAIRADRQATFALAAAARAEAAESEAVEQRDEAERQAAIAEETNQFLVGMFDAADPDNARGAEVTAVEVVESAVNDLGARFIDRPLVKAALQESLADVLHSLGRYEAAEPLYREALEVRRRLLNDDHSDTFNLIDSLAQLLWETGNLAAAETLQHEVLAGRRRVLGNDHPHTFISINNHALLLQDRGNLAAAETLYREALDGNRRVRGDDHPETLNSIHNLAFLLKARGDLAAAETLYREALAGRRRVLGDDHPGTLSSLDGLARVLQDRGNLASAEPQLREALTGRRRVLGDDHPRTLTSINNLALLLQARGDLAAAETLYREALDGNRRVRGDDHPETLNSIHNLAFLLKARGDLAAAETLYREALAGRRRVLGDDHPRTLITINNLAVVLRQRGKFATAEPLQREALAGMRRSLGDAHPWTHFSTHGLGFLLKKRGDLDAAEPLLREALESRRRLLGDNHPRTLQSLNSVASLLQSRGDLAAAETLFREALAGRRRVLGDDHPDTLQSLSDLAVLLAESGNYQGAVPLYREALASRRRVVGDDHPDTRSTANNYARCLDAMGRTETAADVRHVFEIKQPATRSATDPSP
ncbi:MAG: serine/threonine-protein kinase [Planctomycetota bacterium]